MVQAHRTAHTSLVVQLPTVPIIYYCTYAVHILGLTGLKTAPKQLSVPGGNGSPAERYSCALLILIQSLSHLGKTCQRV